MSKKMVTITIPAEEAQRISELDGKAYGGPGGIYQTMLACRKVLLPQPPDSYTIKNLKESDYQRMEECAEWILHVLQYGWEPENE